MYMASAYAKADYSEVSRIGVDETAAIRVPKYVSLFVDVEVHKRLFVAEGRDHMAL